jgi:hypothetical protein
MAKKSESARTTIILALCTLLVGIYAILFGLQTVTSLQTRHWARTSPFLRARPQPLASSAASPAQEKNLSFYGLDFAAPWKGVAKKTEGDARSEVDFAPGEIIILFNPVAEKDIVGSIKSGDPQIYNHYEAIFGTGFYPNNYALYAAVYGAAPAEISPFMARSKVVRIETLLLWKLRFGTDGANSIFSVQTSHMRGFQFGDPSLDRVIVARLFDENDRQVRILFASNSGQPGTISQADINCVLDSLEPTPPQRLK